jgi:hypothetical protein
MKVFLTKNCCRTEPSEIWVWDRDPGSGKTYFGSKGKKVPDLGSEYATLKVPELPWYRQTNYLV